MKCSLAAVASASLCFMWSALAAPPGCASEGQPSALYGGDVQVVVIDPRDPDYLLAGTSSGQVFLSPDGGERWSSPGNALFRGSVVSELLFDPNSSRRVWAAVRGVWEGSGFVAMSDDRGRTWMSRSRGLPERQVYSLAAVAGAPGTLYAGTRVGVFVTENNGLNWRPLSAGRPEIEKVTSLLVDAEDPRTIYAGTWRRAYRSDDAGATWKELKTGMALDSEVFVLSGTPDGEGELWASTCGGVYRGVERGERWSFRSNGLSVRRTPSLQRLPWGRLLAGTVGGVFFSDNNGFSWRPVSGEPLVTLSLAHHPDRPDTVYAGTEGMGVWRSVDGGESFAPINHGLSALRVAGLARAGDEVLAAVRHSRSASGIYSSLDGGLSYGSEPVQLRGILGLGSDGERVFAATENGLFERIEGDWSRFGGLGQRRIDEVAVSGSRVFVRSGTEVFEIRGPSLHPVELGGIVPRDIALLKNTLWMVDRGGRFFTFVPGGIESLPPVRNDALVTGFEAESRRIGAVGTRGAPRLVSTGDANRPFLLAPASGPAVLVSSSGEHELTIELGVEAQYLAGALVHEGRLFVATAGYGVLGYDLEASAVQARQADGAREKQLVEARDELKSSR